MKRRGGVLTAWLVLLWALPAAAAPDLEVALLFATEENDNCVTQVHYILQVLNEGDEDSGPFDLAVVFDAPELPAPGALADHPGLTHTVEEGVAAGELFQVELWWKEEGGVPPGDWTSWMWVDPADEVAEADEENNSAGPIYVHTKEIVCDPPNLVVDAFDLEATPGVLTWFIRVANVGAVDVAETFRIDFFRHQDKMPGYDQVGDESWTVEGLAAGETVEFYADWDNPPPGSYESWVTVDGTAVVFEASEADNVEGPLVACVDCDAVPPDVSADVHATLDASPDTVTVEPPTAKGSTGCSAAPTPSPVPWLLLLVISFLWRRMHHRGTEGTENWGSGVGVRGSG